MTRLKTSSREKDLFNSPSQSQGFIHHYLSSILLVAFGVSLIGVVLATTHDSVSNDDDRHVEKLSITGKLEENLNLPQQKTEKAFAPATSFPDRPALTLETKQVKSLPAPTEDAWTEYTIKPGDSVSGIFDKHEMHSSLNILLGSKKASKALSKIIPGKKLRFRKDADGLAELFYESSAISRLHIVRKGGKNFEAKVIEDEVSNKRVSANGVISSSLFLAGKNAGISDNLIMKLVDIFAYDVDFALDIREGDQFKIVYDERYANGKRISDGPIVAAEFINKNNKLRALRFEDSKGRGSYYTPKGRSMRKAFIRTPVNFTRISSKFNLKRKHPILHKIRAHKGVDYAAPKGTPVKSTGKGKVTFVGRKNGYGKVVIVKHGNKYSTLYAHLNGFRKGLKKGSHVNQGKIVGYVGKTGSATGYHLHYEFRVNGKHKNPLTVKLPNAPSLGKKQMAAFKQQTSPLLKQLTGSTTLAFN